VKRLRITFGLCLLFGLLGAAQAFADSPEHRLKAAFLYNFAKFVEWPEAYFSAQSVINLCVVGADDFGSALDAIDRKKAQGREVIVKREVSVAQSRECQIVYISPSQAKNVADILHTAARGNALTVSDLDGFCQAGGMIGLVVADQRVGFEVNLDAAQKADLRLSAQLLKLAKNVYGAKARP
jgi:YfiR/HmsC-like